MDAVGSLTTALPKGKQVIGIIFRLAMASGMPTIVDAHALGMPRGRRRPERRGPPHPAGPQPRPGGARDGGCDP